MSANVRKNTSIEAKKLSAYDEYVLWYAMPVKQKEAMGLETDTAFAEFYKINDRTLRRWKDRPEFEESVRKLRRQWAFQKTQGVIEGIYRSAVKGNDKSQKLWMQVFEGFTEKTENTQIVKVELSVNDIRFVIESLPKEYHEKYYGYIREIFDTAQSLRFAGQLADRTAPDNIIETAVLSEPDGEADHDAQVVSGKRTDAVAQGYQGRIRTDMGAGLDRAAYTSESNH